MANTKTRGLIYLWTGNGWGKTTSSLGVALRAVGHGKRVIVIQFMKGRKDKIGEYRVRKKLGPLFEIYQFGRPGWVDLKHPSFADKKLAAEGLCFAYSMLKKKPFLLILDEINLATKIGLLDVKEVLLFLDCVPKATTVYLTGRYAPSQLIKRADFATEIKPIKRPMPIKTREGIDF